ncbi:MAG: hypothetical protein KF730_07705 [Sphingomonas sp.]|uniref:hypothetical protein n=1 Tax=Sphingomonas sp. TaxID=28214 RepID=UPI0025E37AC3|nr:hypothetical protein [Sphingomonas sp.]MBX3564445.1 hypothetical protein [Sphingomonas sp.]
MIRALAAAAVLAIAAPAVAQEAPAFTSLTQQFDDFATETAAMPMPERVKRFRERFNALLPGFYAPRNGATEEQYNIKVGRNLATYPAQRDKFLAAARDFSAAYVHGNAHFRRYFPDYAPVMPIYLVHSLGEMDGGTRDIDGKTVAVFGADVIAKIHDSTTIGPFLDHELFHFHHARYFSDCEAMWCALWQEGLATYVAGRMNSTEDDKTLMLTIPRPIRPEVEPKLAEAMCYARPRLDSVDPEVYASFFYGNGKSPYPPRFGYYLGYLIARKIGDGRPLDELAKMPGDQVKPLIEKALADYHCPPAA